MRATIAVALTLLSASLVLAAPPPTNMSGAQVSQQAATPIAGGANGMWTPNAGGHQGKPEWTTTAGGTLFMAPSLPDAYTNGGAGPQTITLSASGAGIIVDNAGHVAGSGVLFEIEDSTVINPDGQSFTNMAWLANGNILCNQLLAEQSQCTWGTNLANDVWFVVAKTTSNPGTGNEGGNFAFFAGDALAGAGSFGGSFVGKAGHGDGAGPDGTWYLTGPGVGVGTDPPIIYSGHKNGGVAGSDPLTINSGNNPIVFETTTSRGSQMLVDNSTGSSFAFASHTNASAATMQISGDGESGLVNTTVAILDNNHATGGIRGAGLTIDTSADIGGTVWGITSSPAYGTVNSLAFSTVAMAGTGDGDFMDPTNGTFFSSLAGNLGTGVFPWTILNVKRVYTRGTSLVSGDFVLSAGWGGTASIGTLHGTDMAWDGTVTTGGAGIAANPTILLTFHDGTWTTVPACQARMRFTSDATNTSTVATYGISATQLLITFNGLPVTANTYVFDAICIGVPA